MSSPVLEPGFKATAAEWQGLPAIALALPHGDSALVALQGAQVLSWVAGGKEQLFLSPRAAHDGSTPIRGGIPLCFPQFNQRGPLVKHGFARTLAWQADADDASVDGDGLRLALRLHDSEATRAVWPHAFAAELRLLLQPGALTVELAVHNTGNAPLAFTAALHSYLRVDEVTETTLQGFDGLRYWDAVEDTHPQQQGALAFGAELDRVYPRPAQAMELHAAGGARLRITQDPAWADTVVWNPGPALCARLADMPADGYRHMLCVEAAAIDAPVVLAPQGRWQAAQRLQHLPRMAQTPKETT
ncbi:D-hexose-6-phosphate mutarotase [Comamonas endophytica]|uniref:Putative glucose-6-phosphate 1-epimerase n=1 Tax=Comamonas endophytica TaxID=2949090 RepID=A0ABY6GC82_9BURK|nr:MULTISPECIES: D-hexose-6-phosphate mutarotase [unclassified Acidovorax]MCD2512966.1 D-hexose-6-phosphate mutarotase [Acidovorax sp. D4N7]UYG52692.1 D-hexose-6-phosphate mutarotase [Acidovorax sp. 5MLIR]